MKEKIIKALIKKYKDEDGIRGFLEGMVADVVVGIIAVIFICIIRVFLY